jgi:hypothetical protein
VAKGACCFRWVRQSEGRGRHDLGQALVGGRGQICGVDEQGRTTPARLPRAQVRQAGEGCRARARTSAQIAIPSGLTGKRNEFTHLPFMVRAWHHSGRHLVQERSNAPTVQRRRDRPSQRKRITCSARIGRRRSDRCQTSIQQDFAALHHCHDGTWGRRRRPQRPVCPAPISGAPKPASAEPAAGPPHSKRIVRYTAKRGLRRWSRRLGRKHHDGRARSRDIASQHRASHWHFGENSAHWPPHALHSHRSLQIRIEKSITSRSAESVLPGRGHGGRVRRRRNITRRPNLRHPSGAASSASSAALSRGAFSRLQARGFPAACPQA